MSRRKERNKCKNCIHYLSTNECAKMFDRDVRLSEEEFQINKAIGECVYFAIDDGERPKRARWISIN